MNRRQKLYLAAYILIGVGLVTLARFMIFSHGLREFFLALLAGCIGIGLTYGGIAGVVYTFSPPMVYAEGSRVGTPSSIGPLAHARQAATQISFALIVAATVLCVAGAVLLFPFMMLGGCCR